MPFDIKAWHCVSIFFFKKVKAALVCYSVYYDVYISSEVNYGRKFNIVSSFAFCLKTMPYISATDTDLAKAGFLFERIYFCLVSLKEFESIVSYHMIN